MLNLKITNDRTLFLTGATGLVGSEILRHLIGSGDIRVYILIRAGNRDELRQRFYTMLFDLGLDPYGSDAIHPVSGDICLTNLGLDPQIADQLAQEVTDVIHCASDVSFGRSIMEARKVNLSGIINLMGLVSHWRHIEQIAHISTVQVAGKRTGVIYESELFHTSGFVNSYEQSKYEAEVYLSGLMGDLPIAIYRTSGLVGDSRTGCVRQFNWLHQLLRLFSKDLLPILPGDPDLKVDLLPIDWLVETLLYMFSERFEPGMTYHMAAGEQNSLTIRELVGLSHRCLVQSQYAHRRKVRLPKIIDQEAFAGLIDQPSNSGKYPQAKLLHTLMEDFIPQWFLPKTFDLTHLRTALAGSSYSVPDIKVYYPKIIDYCLLSNWGRANVEPAISPTRCLSRTSYDSYEPSA